MAAIWEAAELHQLQMSDRLKRGGSLGITWMLMAAIWDGRLAASAPAWASMSWVVLLNTRKTCVGDTTTWPLRTACM